MKKNPQYKLIPNWQNLSNTCSDCGINKSVKYELNNRKLCNVCFGKFLHSECEKKISETLKKIKEYKLYEQQLVTKSN